MPSARSSTVAVALALALASIGLAACGSDAGSPTAPTLPNRPASTTTTTGRVTTSTGRVTTTTSDPTTTSSDRTTTTSESTTTTEPVTSTTRRVTTTTAEVTTTTAPTTSTTTPVTGTDDAHAGWIVLGVLAALTLLLIAVAAARSSRRRRWYTAGEGVLRDGRALVDLGSAGPAQVAPEQEIAHWDMIDQRAAALAARVPEASKVAINSTERSILAGLATTLDGYRGSIRTGRTLRIGPPAPTPEQVRYADADARQHLSDVAGELNQLDQVLAPDRRTP